jgi:hypothetical protein
MAREKESDVKNLDHPISLLRPRRRVLKMHFEIEENTDKIRFVFWNSPICAWRNAFLSWEASVGLILPA